MRHQRAPGRRRPPPMTHAELLRMRTWLPPGFLRPGSDAVVGRLGAGKRSAVAVKSSPAQQPGRNLRLYRRPLLVLGTLRGTEVESGGQTLASLSLQELSALQRFASVQESARAHALTFGSALADGSGIAYSPRMP
ncbi:TPA: hypothetical protein BOS_9420 [Bos taurus]|nr:TPA: hypothetical protein BOS_9420 [Bos taurus]